MRKVLIILQYILMIFLLGFLLVFTNYRQNCQEISLNDIIIKDSEDGFINDKLILDYLNNKSVRFDSVSISDFSKKELEHILLSHPSIKGVEVFANQKGVVDILIEQKKAIIRIKSNTDDYFLDEFGKKMQLSDSYIPRLIVATGDITIEHHLGIYKFVKEINKSAFWNAQITQIHVEKNDVLLIPIVGNQKIHIGDFKNISEKLENLYQFYKIAMPVKGWQYYSDINLRFKNQIVCTKSKDK